MSFLPDNERSSLLLSGYETCRAYTRHHAKSFYFSSFLLPKEKRFAAYAVYTFCRYADNLIDHSTVIEESKIKEKFADLLNFLDDVYCGNLFAGSAFADTVRKFNIPKHYFTDLIDGVMMDMSKKRYATFMELDTYCYKVASVVGLMMSEIFGYSNKAALPYAIYLGKAMQLTNILRDVAEDYSIGRIYLPKDETDSFEYFEQDIGNKVIDDRFAAMMRFNVDRNKAFYELASHGLPYLTNDGSRTTAVLMYKIYSGILTEIENHGYDIYGERRYVSTASKLRMTGAYLLNPRERKRFARLPQAKHQESIRSLTPNLTFEE
jgi:phytoene synthase